MTENFEIEKAEQQLVGYLHALKGYDIVSLVQDMNLKPEEWLQVKEDMPHLPWQIVRDIDELFGGNPEPNPPVPVAVILPVSFMLEVLELEEGTAYYVLLEEESDCVTKDGKFAFVRLEQPPYLYLAIHRDYLSTIKENYPSVTFKPLSEFFYIAR